jgi:hypothetical protein
MGVNTVGKLLVDPQFCTLAILPQQPLILPNKFLNLKMELLVMVSNLAYPCFGHIAEAILKFDNKLVGIFDFE